MSTSYTEAEILEQFSNLVAKSLRISPAKVTADADLSGDLGAESLDLIEITMETETLFNIWLPQKSILETAAEVFGRDVLVKDGFLTSEGKQLLSKRLPVEDAYLFQGEVAVKDLNSYFLRVGTWVNMIDGLVRHTPTRCSDCGGALSGGSSFDMKCKDCGRVVPLQSGEELNLEWVRDYYEKEYLPSRPQELSRATASSL